MRGTSITMNQCIKLKHPMSIVIIGLALVQTDQSTHVQTPISLKLNGA
jgi:hypothetical protein